jgi:hypothetical protein
MQLRTEILEPPRPRIERREDARRHFIPEMPALPRRKTFRRERFDGPHAPPTSFGIRRPERDGQLRPPFRVHPPPAAIIAHRRVTSPQHADIRPLPLNAVQCGDGNTHQTVSPTPSASPIGPALAMTTGWAVGAACEQRIVAGSPERVEHHEQSVHPRPNSRKRITFADLGGGAYAIRQKATEFGRRR